MAADEAVDASGVPWNRCSRCGTRLAFTPSYRRWDGNCPFCRRYDVVVWDPDADGPREQHVRVMPTGAVVREFWRRDPVGDEVGVVL